MVNFTSGEIANLLRMKAMREGGYYETDGSVPVPEIAADGEGPDDGWLPKPTYGYEYTTLFCANCSRETQHGQVAVFENTGEPVFHCNICCACHLCLERLSMSLRGSQLLYEAVKDVGNKLVAWEGLPTTIPANPTFCTDCGAMLRCSVCMGEGPGGCCQTCGQKEDITGRCSSCWKGA